MKNLDNKAMAIYSVGMEFWSKNYHNTVLIQSLNSTFGGLSCIVWRPLKPPNHYFDNNRVGFFLPAELILTLRDKAFISFFFILIKNK